MKLPARLSEDQVLGFRTGSNCMAGNKQDNVQSGQQGGVSTMLVLSGGIRPGPGSCCGQAGIRYWHL